MKRTPIITAGQVYLHPEANRYVDATGAVRFAGEYLVVTRSNRGEIQFKGAGFSGMNELELFLERFGPVDVADLTPTEVEQLTALLGRPDVPLSTGWVGSEDDDLEGEDEDLALVEVR